MNNQDIVDLAHARKYKKRQRVFDLVLASVVILILTMPQWASASPAPAKADVTIIFPWPWDVAPITPFIWPMIWHNSFDAGGVG